MFESAMLEQRATRSRLLTVAAMGGQLAVVSLAVLIPLFSPAVIQTFTRQANIPLVPTKPLARLETTQSSAVGSVAQPLISFSQLVRRQLVAPSSINPIARFIDESVTIATGGNQTGPFVPGNAPGTGSPLGSILETAAPPPPPPAKVLVDTTHTGPVAIGGKVQEAKLVKRVIPLYPALAKQARVQGVVRLQGIIAKDGTIQKLEVMSGHPLLVTSAVDAVRQWVYAPTQLNGRAVEVICPIDVIFTLSQ